MFVVSLLVGVVPVLWRVRHSCSCWRSPVRCRTRWRRRWGRCWRVRCSRWYCPGAGNGSFVGVVVRVVGEAAGAAAIRPLVVVLTGSRLDGMAGVLLLLLLLLLCTSRRRGVVVGLMVLSSSCCS